MIEWLKLLFHVHKWETLDTGILVAEGSTIGNWYDCRCSICGKIKGFRT